MSIEEVKQNQPVLIRRMTLKDVDAVHAIETATFRTPWSKADFEHEMTKNPCARYLVAEAEGAVVAFAGAHIILDEGHITNIAVLEPYRGRGIGRQITQALLQYASNLGASYLTLEVRAHNEKAQALYRSLGFIKVGVRKKYYDDTGEDGWIMVCDKLPEAQEDFTEEETIFTE